MTANLSGRLKVCQDKLRNLECDCLCVCFFFNHKQQCVSTCLHLCRAGPYWTAPASTFCVCWRMLRTLHQLVIWSHRKKKLPSPRAHVTRITWITFAVPERLTGNACVTSRSKSCARFFCQSLSQNAQLRGSLSNPGDIRGKVLKCFHEEFFFCGPLQCSTLF